MRDPNDLKVFERADVFVRDVYRLTVCMPAEEKYGLTSQIRRAAVSIPTNIVEGCSRRSQADFARFLEIAYGSAMELEYLLGLSGRIFSIGGVPDAQQEVREISKMLNALLGSVRSESGSSPG